MPNMTTNHAITYATTQAKGDTNRTTRKTCKGRMKNTKRSPNPKLQNTERSFCLFYSSDMFRRFCGLGFLVNAFRCRWDQY